jgi:hypothetical protein
MTATTLKRLPAGVTVKVYEAARADPFHHYFEQVPGTPLTSGVVAATGDLTLDLPDGIELMAVLPDGSARRVLNATTQGGSP